MRNLSRPSFHIALCKSTKYMDDVINDVNLEMFMLDCVPTIPAMNKSVSYNLSKACSRSAMMSSGSSIPTESLTKSSVIPVLSRISLGTPA